MPVLLSLGPVAARNYAEMLIIINHQTLITPKQFFLLIHSSQVRKSQHRLPVH